MKFINPFIAYPHPGIAVLETAEAWWDAEHTGNTIVSGAFSNLVDLSGNSNDISQSTAGNRPLRTTDSDGNVGAEFDGSNDYLTTSTGSDDFMRNFDAGGTVIIALRTDSNGAGGFGRLYCKGTNSEKAFTQNSMRHLFTFAMSTTEAVYQLTTQISFGVKHVISFAIDKTNTTATAKMTVDSNVYTPGAGITENNAGAGTPTDHAGLSFFFGNSSSTTACTDGLIYAMAFFDTILSDADRDNVIAYWGQRYNITI